MPDPQYVNSGQNLIQDEEAFLSLARDRFKLVDETEAEYRKLALDDLKFYNGDQWEEHVRRQREADCRPCLTLNRLPQFVHSISNEIRQNKPAPHVSPVDSEADPKTAEILQGILRYIERNSNAPAVRSYASLYSIITGRTYYRVVTEVSDTVTGDQDIFIRRIKNPLTVYMDPTCTQADCSDAKWCFITEDLTEEQFKSRYPGHELTSAEDFRSTGDDAPLWRWRNGVRIAEYFCEDEEEIEVLVLSDGTEIPFDAVPEGAPVIGRRTYTRKRMLWTCINGSEILEQTEWQGKYVPVVRIVGEEYELDGRTEYIGIVRPAKDPQRMLNYWESAKTEAIALAPRAPYIAAEGQLENHEQEWAQANQKNFAALTYKVKEVGGNLVPPPQRQAYEPPIQAISIAEGGVIDHLKAATGIYDPSLGNRSNETSGIAIRERRMQGSNSNYHFIDNVSTAVRYECKVVLDLIPSIYDRPGRVVRIIGEDNSEEQVTINQEHMDRSGMVRMYALDTGRYDVAVEVGPSYATKRQESVDSMTAFATAAPQLVPLYADLYVAAMDWPGAKQISERLRPPGIPGDDQPQIPPQVAMQMQQLGQENQQLKAALEQMAQVIQGKQVEAQSRERIAAEDNATKRQIAELQARVDLLLKQTDLGAKGQQQQAEFGNKTFMQWRDINSQEKMKFADIESKENIAMLNAEVKATTDQMNAAVNLEKQRQQPQEFR